jgi:hypothetical protein
LPRPLVIGEDRRRGLFLDICAAAQAWLLKPEFSREPEENSSRSKLESWFSKLMQRAIKGADTLLIRQNFNLQ